MAISDNCLLLQNRTNPWSRTHLALQQIYYDLSMHCYSCLEYELMWYLTWLCEHISKATMIWISGGGSLQKVGNLKCIATIYHGRYHKVWQLSQKWEWFNPPPPPSYTHTPTHPPPASPHPPPAKRLLTKIYPLNSITYTIRIRL